MGKRPRSRPNPWGKRCLYPLDTRLGGLQSRSRRCERKNTSTGNRTPGVPSLYPVNVLTELIRVLGIYPKIRASFNARSDIQPTISVSSYV
jgi:hypothetical protein